MKKKDFLHPSSSSSSSSADLNFSTRSSDPNSVIFVVGEGGVGVVLKRHWSVPDGGGIDYEDHDYDYCDTDSD